MTDSISDDIYQQVILENNRSPKNFRRMEHPTHMAEGINPLCGDAYTVYLCVSDAGTITDVSFDGRGCAISKASASMMTECLIGRTAEDAKRLFEEFHEMVVGNALGDEERAHLGKLRVFAGVWRYPARVKCAALPWHAMQSAIRGDSIATTEDSM